MKSLSKSISISLIFCFIFQVVCFASPVFFPAIPATSYAYDYNGNLTQKVFGLTTETFTYDYENRLKTYTAPGQSASYTYNGQSQRISKTVNGVTTSYYYDGPELVLERTGANSIYYIHSNRIDELICDSRGYSYHSDGLGSIANLTDNAGLNANNYNYKAFGSIRSQSGTVANAWRYTGRQYDAESGLYFYRNRYYDAGVGRFITRDPIGFAGGINLYGYVGNNPVNWVDPWGFEPGSKTWWKEFIPDFDRARQIAKEELENHSGHNDLDDAMRHADWSERMYKEINPLTSWLAGTGHEIQGYFDKSPSMSTSQYMKESRMDIHNNAEGRNAAKEGRPIDPKNLVTSPNDIQSWPY